MAVSASRDGKPSYMQATGALPHPLTNDYMFKALLQKNGNVLKHLICSLLHLRPEEVQRVEIRNPIILGETLTEDFDSKIFVLDINVLLNNQTLINLEMQVINYLNWPERAITYLSRSFDQLSRGEDYIQVKPVIHIGFLDFTLFPEYPEFYATYKMMNEKNHHIFTDKFVLSVVDLNQTDLATREDREWKIDYWASLFKAATWEELKMLAEQSSVMKDAVETIYELTADEAIREQCKAREKHVREINTVLGERDMAFRELQQQKNVNKQLEREKKKLVQEQEQLEREKKELVQEHEQLEEEKSQLARQLELLTLENQRLREQITGAK